LGVAGDGEDRAGRGHPAQSAVAALAERGLARRGRRRRGARLIGRNRRHVVLLSSGRLARDVCDLELDSVGVVEEHRVIPRHVRVFLRPALDLGAVRAQPLGPLCDRGARRRREAEVVEAQLVAVVLAARRLRRLAQADGPARPAEVVDRLAALALDLADPVEAERAEQLAVEGQAALDRGDDEVDVADLARAHGWTFRLRRAGAESYLQSG